MRRSPKFLVAVLALAAALITACGSPAQQGSQSSTPAAQPAQGSQQAQESQPAQQSQSSAPASGIALPERIKSAGKVVIGMDTTYAPMEFIADDGKTFTGFDVDLGKALAEKMGVEAEFVSVNWDGIIAGLVSGHYDAIISSMNITEERLMEIDFVEYAKMSQVFVTRHDKAPIKTEKDLAGRVIAVQADTTSQYWVEELPAEYQPAEMKKFVDNNAVYLEIASGGAEGAVTDEPIGRYYAAQYKDVMAVTGMAIEPEPIGIGIRKDDAELKAAFAQALEAIKADGTYDQLMQKWFGGELGK